MKIISGQQVPRMAASKFTFELAVAHNGVFLMENHSERPFVRPSPGWNIVGYTTNAPWPGQTNGFAVMLEKTTPGQPHKFYGNRGDEMAEGTRLWQHWIL